jgi:hypothetical protein
LPAHPALKVRRQAFRGRLSRVFVFDERLDRVRVYPIALRHLNLPWTKKPAASPSRPDAKGGYGEGQGSEAAAGTDGDLTGLSHASQPNGTNIVPYLFIILLKRFFFKSHI